MKQKIPDFRQDLGECWRQVRTFIVTYTFTELLKIFKFFLSYGLPGCAQIILKHIFGTSTVHTQKRAVEFYTFIWVK